MVIFKAEWFVFSFIAFLLWGIWGFFSKIANAYMSPSSVYLYGSIGALLVTIFAVLVLGFKLEAQAVGIMYSLLAGISGGAGVVFFYFAMREGKASIVVTLTALYPLVTLVLSCIILKEHITIKQTIGIFLAIIAMVLLSK
ncbi:MAG: EamA family transporter [Thermodesulfovibrionales bacterium]